ncbi:MAG: hypothetical protein HOK81_11865 [Rhodospirillaceae bacterium]|nr:hypothetical protein [Rhodospirillaceae bacterium]
MNVRIALHHRTRYAYASGVTLGPQLIRLRPAPHARAEIVSYSLRIEPADHVVHWIHDPHGNHLARATFPDPAERFEVTVDLVAELGPINPFDFIVQPPFDFWPFESDEALRDQMPAYHRTEEAGPMLRAWLDSLDRTPRATVDLLGLLIGRLAAEVAYEIRYEPGIQTPEETFERGIGSCRDTAWLLVQTLRHLGFTARFVSGYLIQLATDGPGPDGGPPEVETDSPTFTPGPTSTCRGWVGSASIRPPACSRRRGISRWPARPSPSRRRRSRARHPNRPSSSIT